MFVLSPITSKIVSVGMTQAKSMMFAITLFLSESSGTDFPIYAKNAFQKLDF